MLNGCIIAEPSSVVLYSDPNRRSGEESTLAIVTACILADVKINSSFVGIQTEGVLLARERMLNNGANVKRLHYC